MATTRHNLPVFSVLFCSMAVYMSAGSGSRQVVQLSVPIVKINPVVTRYVNIYENPCRTTTAAITARDTAQNHEVPNEYQAYVPTTPSPENVNCYIDVPIVQTVGGRCVRFGRSPRWSCQSGIHMQISDECERLIRRRRPRVPRS